MYPARYFPAAYFPAAYWPKVGATLALVARVGLSGGLHLSLTGERGLLYPDLVAQARNIVMVQGEHGPEILELFIPASVLESFYLRSYPDVIQAQINWNGFVLWRGRVEDVSIVNGGVNLTAFGYWRAFTDSPYTAIWSTRRFDAWREVPYREDADYKEARWQFNRNGQLSIGPQKNAVYGHQTDLGAFSLSVPDGGSRNWQAADFDYTVILPEDWKAEFIACDSDLGNPVTVWSLTADGTPQTGSVSETFSTKARLIFRVYNNTGSDATYSGETGNAYLRVTNLRVKTTNGDVTADIVIMDMVAWERAANPTHLSSAAVLVESPNVDMGELLIEDTYPIDALNRFAQSGDDQTPPRIWECGVTTQQVVYFRPRGSVSQTWYVDVADIELKSTLDPIRNFTYGVYRDSSGDVQRTAGNLNQESINRSNLYRIAAIPVQTTEDAFAVLAANAALADQSTPPPQISVVLAALHTAAGDWVPKWLLANGDMVVIRNLPTLPLSDVARFREFRVAAARYRLDADELEVTPEAFLPTLDVLIAHQDLAR